MKKLWLRNALALLAVILVVGVAETAFAQYLVSAKAGFVNRADGQVDIQRAENEDGTRGRASLGTQMKVGDRLITSANGRADLLNPGSYLRMNSNTEVVAVNTMLDEMRFEVVSGSVIVEVGELEKGIVIEISTPQGVMSVAKAGLQRIDITKGATVIAVRQGEAFLGTREQVIARTATKLGRGKQVRLEGGAEVAMTQLQLAKINKDEIDRFDTWSFDRGQSLMAANYTALRSGGSASFQGNLGYGWYYSPFYNSYTFIPRGGGFYSPYGFPFCRRFSDFAYYFPYGLPYYYYRPAPSGAGGGGGGGGNASARVIAGIDRAPIERSMGGRSIGGFDDSGVGRAGGMSAPSGGGSVSSPSAPASISGGASRGGDMGGASGGGSAPSRGGRP